MNKIAEVIKLLLVDDSLEDAERLTSMLRNASITVRAGHARTLAELDEQLKAQTPDIILAAISNATASFAEVAQSASRGGKDVALIVMLDSLQENAIADALREGANAVAARGRADLFVAVVRREFDSLKMRRSVRRLEANLRESERRCDALLESAHDPIAYVHEGMHVRANKAYLDIFGHADFAEIEGMSILDMIAPEAAGEFKTLLKSLSRGETPPAKLDIKLRRANGSTFQAVMEFAAASFEGEPCQQIVLRQQVGNAELAREIDALRSKDLVTDLYNRQYGLTALERMVAAAATGTPNQFMLLVEPDNFRKQLDTIGIGNADLLLGDMANLLRRNLDAVNLDSSDVICRFGEHSFAILIHGRETENVRAIANGLCKTFEDHIFEIGKQSISATVSVGGTLLGETNANSQAVLSQADNALRSAQQLGGNRSELVDPGLQDRSVIEHSRDMLKNVQKAIDSDGFVLYYQPIISLHGIDGEFHEILLRLPSDKGDISPTMFFPVAEENGLLPAIDRCVITNAIATLARRAGKATTFFIKLSASSMEEPGLLPWIAQQLKQARLPGESLVFEMPESKVVTHMKTARDFVGGLRQLHCGFALEQFGSGVNSFQLLKHIDAGYLKIDRSYMTDLPKNRDHQDFIRKFCLEAHQAGKLVIAEFVEDAASMSILFTCGVNFVQGNFLSEPEKVLVG